jgi:hypothetical protein
MGALLWITELRTVKKNINKVKIVLLVTVRLIVVIIVKIETREDGVYTYENKKKIIIIIVKKRRKERATSPTT